MAPPSQSDLYAQYVPPLDEPLFLALSSDVDFSFMPSVSQLVELLDTLAADAFSHEPDTETPNGFRPGQWQIPNRLLSLEDHGSSSDSATGVTPSTSSSDDSQTILAEMFPEFSAARLQDSLLANSYNLDGAIEELLNLVFLDQEPHGDTRSFATSRPHTSTLSKKQRKKARKYRSDLVAHTPPDPPSASVNAWQAHQSDIAFLSEHTLLPHPRLTSIYHEYNASLPATIRSLTDTQSTGLSPDHDMTDVPIPILAPCLELVSAFPILDLATALQIFSLVNQSEPSAHALAQVLHTANLSALKPSLYPTPQPPKLYDHHPALPSKRPTSLASASIPPTSTIDLHGLTASEALPLVSRSVDAWWAQAQSERGIGVDGKLYQSPDWQPLTVITGRGIHSRDHVSVLGPRVVKLLIKDGWRVRIAGDGGSLEVVGRVKRR